MGEIHLYMGDGGGKTTTALGVGLRAVGHGYRVVMIQFMKGRQDIGEYKAIKSRLSPQFEIYQFGRPSFVNLQKPSDEDRELARKGLEFARQVLKKKTFLLILDEINLAATIGLVDVKEVLKLLDEIPEETHVILTGRHPPREFVDRADFVTYMACVKHPFSEGVRARKGLEY